MRCLNTMVFSLMAEYADRDSQTILLLKTLMVTETGAVVQVGNWSKLPKWLFI